MVANLPGVRIGASCTLAIESADGYGEYKSRIEDFEEDRLMVAMPSSRGSFIVPTVGDQMQVIVPSPGAGTLFLESEVIGRQNQPVPMIIVRVVAVGHQQARGYFRINVTLRPLECAVWDNTFGQEQAYWKPIHAILQDMSGGGIGMLSHDEVPVGSRMKVHFPLPYGGGECRAIGEVKMCRPMQRDSRQSRWIVGVQLEQINRQTRERLIKAVHRYQAEERRLGYI